MDRIIQTVRSFFKEHASPEGPLLLAISGGADSMALLQASYELLPRFPFHVVHIDHRWRDTSSREAEALRSWAEQRRIPFHLHTLSPPDFQGNWEAKGREQRLQLFRQLVEKGGFQAVVLAHHADDQAETILKRICEGSSLSGWPCMRPVSAFEGMLLWRPLLSFTKKEIAEWVARRKVPFFEDPTNGNIHYLRARMRKQMFPLLAQQFGKEVVPSLCRFAEEAADLRLWMEQQAQELLIPEGEGVLGQWYDWTKVPISQAALLRFALQKVMGKGERTPPRVLVDDLSSALFRQIPNRSFSWSGRHFFADRGCLFVINPSPASFSWTGCLSGAKEEKTTGWREAWEGRAEVMLPEGDYRLAPASAGTPYGEQSTTLGKWWNRHRVPAILREKFPVVWEGERVVHEFLSGRKKTGRSHLWKEGCWVQLRLQASLFPGGEGAEI